MVDGHRRNERLVREGRGLEVCGLLADWLRGHQDRRGAARLLLAASQGVKGTKVPWKSLASMEARSGRIVGTVWLGENARMRDGEIHLKGRTLPETLLMRLQGRPLSTVVDHPIFGRHRISTARSTKAGLVVRVDAAPVAFGELRKDMDL